MFLLNEEAHRNKYTAQCSVLHCAMNVTIFGVQLKSGKNSKIQMNFRSPTDDWKKNIIGVEHQEEEFTRQSKH